MVWVVVLVFLLGSGSSFGELGGRSVPQRVGVVGLSQLLLAVVSFGGCCSL